MFNSKGSPTVEVDVILSDGAKGRAAAAGGTSRGRFEPKDLLDGDMSYFNGMGVQSAIKVVHDRIAPELVGCDAFDQEAIDETLLNIDGSETKKNLGGNTMIAVSVACLKAAAVSKRLELFEHFGNGRLIPLPFIYVMFAGPVYVSSEGVCDFQEYALIPLNASSYVEGYIAALRIYRRLSFYLSEKKGYVKAGYSKISGIPIAKFDSNELAFEFLVRLIEEEGFIPGKDFGIHVDIASNQLFKHGRYHLNADREQLSTIEMIDRMVGLCNKYPVVSLEDPLVEDDWKGWQIITKLLGSRVQISGDDIFVTDPDRLSHAINIGVANAIVIKPNQIGTISQTFKTIRLAKTAGYATVISPRSGELWDPYLVHLCVGQNLGQGKLVGAYSSGENNLNEIIRICDQLGSTAIQNDGAFLRRRL